MSNLFAIVCRDVPNSGQARANARDAHFAHVEAILDRIAIAGPLKNDKGEIVGSLVVVHADSKADAQAILESDPYFAANVWAESRIEEFVAAAGDWIGGKIW
jgi:uncharacterized protein YciI